MESKAAVDDCGSRRLLCANSGQSARPHDQVRYNSLLASRTGGPSVPVSCILKPNYLPLIGAVPRKNQIGSTVHVSARSR